MQVTPAYLSSVATFYDMLRTEPVGSRYVYVCTSVACHLRNAKAVYEAIEEEAGDQGLEDVEVREFECLGACDMAPMASIDGRYVGPLAEDDAPELVGALKEGREPLPGRGLSDPGFRLPWDEGGARPTAPARRRSPTCTRPAGPGRTPRCSTCRRARGEPPPRARRRRLQPARPGRPACVARAARRGGRAVTRDARAARQHRRARTSTRSTSTSASAATRALRKALLEMTPEAVLHELEESGLRGRGGAGFSMGKKASFIPKGTMDKYLCCNADESEPGTFKDRLLMQKNPHLLIEGCIIGSIAAGANKGFIFIRGEY